MLVAAVEERWSQQAVDLETLMTKNGIDNTSKDVPVDVIT